jgi:hypothetical protein
MHEKSEYHRLERKQLEQNPFLRAQRRRMRSSNEICMHRIALLQQQVKTHLSIC